ncbi:hypothetical protein R0K05_21055, partial [Planococcus sp. SIMBA_160]
MTKPALRRKSGIRQVIPIHSDGLPDMTRPLSDRLNPRLWLRDSLRALSRWLWKLSPAEKAERDAEFQRQ